MFVKLIAALPTELVEQANDSSQDSKNLAVGIGCIAVIVIAALFWAHKK